MKRGILLINLGTPNSTRIRDVRRYLREFLTDERVIDIPTFMRYLLVYGVIAPFRSKKTAHAYELIWSDQKAPLLLHSQNMATELQKELGPTFKVVLGMRYGQPCIADAIDELKDCESISILPLYPQYSSAATGSSLEACLRILSKKTVIPFIHMIRDFYNHPDYIAAHAKHIQTYLEDTAHLLFSYHGIPERQLHKSGCRTICEGVCVPNTKQVTCYRAQCFETSQLLAQKLQRNPNQYSIAFQSRLGTLPWTQPYTEALLGNLRSQGVTHIAVVCPSFVADCLETLEEIGVRAKDLWFALGGTQFTLIPSLNSNLSWIQAIRSIINESL